MNYTVEHHNTIQKRRSCALRFFFLIILPVMLAKQAFSEIKESELEVPQLDADNALADFDNQVDAIENFLAPS